MSQRTSDDLLFTFCIMHLEHIKKGFKDQRPFEPSKAEAQAHLKIINSLYELAAGAAVRNRLKKRFTDALVELHDELVDLIEWNVNKFK